MIQKLEPRELWGRGGSKHPRTHPALELDLETLKMMACGWAFINIYIIFSFKAHASVCFIRSQTKFSLSILKK